MCVCSKTQYFVYKWRTVCNFRNFGKCGLINRKMVDNRELRNNMAGMFSYILQVVVYLQLGNSYEHMHGKCKYLKILGLYYF